MSWLSFTMYRAMMKAKRIRIKNRVRMVLGRFFKWAISEALIKENPVSGQNLDAERLIESAC